MKRLKINQYKIKNGKVIVTQWERGTQTPPDYCETLTTKQAIEWARNLEPPKRFEVIGRVQANGIDNLYWKVWKYFEEDGTIRTDKEFMQQMREAQALRELMKSFQNVFGFRFDNNNQEQQAKAIGLTKFYNYIHQSPITTLQIKRKNYWGRWLVNYSYEIELDLKNDEFVLSLFLQKWVSQFLGQFWNDYPNRDPMAPYTSNPDTMQFERVLREWTRDNKIHLLPENEISTLTPIKPQNKSIDKERGR